MVLAISTVLLVPGTSALARETEGSASEELPTAEIRKPGALAGFRTYPLLDRAYREIAAGRPGQARVYIDRALELDGASPEIWIMSGYVAQQLGDSSGAVSRFDEAVSLNGRSAPARLHRGLARLHAGDSRGGLLDIGRALDLGTLDEGNDLLARRVLVQLGYRPEHLSALAAEDIHAPLRAAADAASTEDAYDMLSAATNLPPDLALQRARAAYRLGRHPQALSAAMAIDAKALAPRQRTSLTALLADTNLALGDVDAAVSGYLDVLADERLDPDASLRAVEAARRAGRDAALVRFLEARSKWLKGSELTTLQLAIGDARAAIGSEEAARAAFVLVTSDPDAPATDRASAWRRAGSSFERSGRPLQAWLAHGRAHELSGRADDATRANTLAMEQEVAAYVERRREQALRLVRARQTPPPPRRSAGTKPTGPSRSDIVEGLRTRFESGGCHSGLADLEQRRTIASADPSLYMNAAECFGREQDSEKAKRLFHRALESSEKLSTEQRFHAWTSIAYLSETRQEYADAHEAWRAASDLGTLPGTRTNAARNARLAESLHTARAELVRIDFDTLESDANRLDFLDEVSLAFAQTDPVRALDALELGIAIHETAYRHLRAAALAAELEEHDRAVAHFGRAAELEPDDGQIRLALGYAQIRQGEPAQAARTFTTLALDHPDDADIALQQAYLLKGEREFVRASSAFRRYVDLRTEGADDVDTLGLHTVRSEISALEKRSYVQAVVVAETGGGSGTAARSSVTTLDDTAYVEAGWKPGSFEYGTGGVLTAFARLSTTMNDRFGEPDDGGGRTSLGLRWQPSPAANFYVQGQRQFVGDDTVSGDSWILTAAYARSRGAPVRPRTGNWSVGSVYAEASYSFADTDARFAFAELSTGRAFSIGSRLTLTPHAVAVARYSDDMFDTRHRVEAGLGISARAWFGGDAYRTPGGHADLSLQYLSSLDDDGTGDGDRAVVSLTIGF